MTLAAPATAVQAQTGTSRPVSPALIRPPAHVCLVDRTKWSRAHLSRHVDGARLEPVIRGGILPAPVDEGCGVVDHDVYRLIGQGVVREASNVPGVDEVERPSGVTAAGPDGVGRNPASLRGGQRTASLGPQQQFLTLWPPALKKLASGASIISGREIAEYLRLAQNCSAIGNWPRNPNSGHGSSWLTRSAYSGSGQFPRRNPPAGKLPFVENKVVVVSVDNGRGTVAGVELGDDVVDGGLHRAGLGGTPVRGITEGRGADQWFVRLFAGRDNGRTN